MSKLFDPPPPPVIHTRLFTWTTFIIIIYKKNKKYDKCIVIKFKNIKDDSNELYY